MPTSLVFALWGSFSILLVAKRLGSGFFEMKILYFHKNQQKFETVPPAGCPRVLCKAVMETPNMELSRGRRNRNVTRCRVRGERCGMI